jgi:hypothetical protein
LCGGRRWSVGASTAQREGGECEAPTNLKEMGRGAGLTEEGDGGGASAQSGEGERLRSPGLDNFTWSRTRRVWCGRGGMKCRMR